MEWGISLKIKTVRHKLWFVLFLRIAAIFAVFVLVLALSNVAFLIRFFTEKEKRLLKEQIGIIAELDFEDSNTVISTLSSISEKYSFDAEIYTSTGRIVYTTHGGQMMDYFNMPGREDIMMAHEDVTVLDSEQLEDGIVFETALRRFEGGEILLCRKELSNGNFAEVQVPKLLIANSAAVANEFIVVISLLCFLLSVLWVLLLARRVSRPIAEMNEITKDMAALRFERQLQVDRRDEIGELAVSINELSSSLSDALEDLKQKNEKLQDDIEAGKRLDAMRRAFVADVSHELKTPISIISGYAEGLKMDISPASREEYCNIIMDESKRMNKLVLSLLELSRYEAGEIPLNEQAFDLSDLTRELLDRIFVNTNITAQNKIPAGTMAFADPAQIEQVLKAYLENAAAHTPEGGKVTVSTESRGDELIRVSVLNTGSHIAEEDMPKIWQSFFRGDSSHKRESSRFGIGLSIVSAIIKRHGSQCGVYNTEDGVCFWFDLKKA